MPKKLNSGEIHVLRLIAKQRTAGGWAKVSAAVFPLIEKMPRELVESWPTETGGRARLTDDGDALLDAMAWL
jgi:hypothetical protein